MPADGAVGRGRPPLHTRFQKGQSGNPRGRPRRDRSLAGELLAALEERTETIGRDGKPRRVARRRLGIARLADGFARGDPHATRIVLELAAQVERRTPPEPGERPPLSAADREVLENFLARLRAP